MANMDYLLTSLIFTNINKISTGTWLYDILISILMIIFIHSLSYIRIEQFNDIIHFFNHKTNIIVYSSSENNISQRYRALMHYISQSNEPTVKGLFEIELKKYSRKTDNLEYETSVYRVAQTKKFIITQDINGRVYSSYKDKVDNRERTSYTEYQNLEISSDKKSLKELTKWVDTIEKEYKDFLKMKIVDTQTLVEVSWSAKDNDTVTFYTQWASNVTFENRFFTGKKEIVERINFFLNNEQWYIDRGIPYTMGILLWGEPGCGKTGFIKALMNLTKRHGIDIKLTDKFNMNRLKEIICDDEISEDIIIPQNKRIILFEDIDAMGEIIKDRDLKKQDKQTEQPIQPTIDITKFLKKKSKDIDIDICNIYSEQENNNLSYFLNVLDGLNECPGRIIIMTTNKPEYLDKALIRPGRIDFKINMTKATTADITDILNFYWSTQLEKPVNDNWSDKLSHAEIVSCCRLSNNIEETLEKINEKIIL